MSERVVVHEENWGVFIRRNDSGPPHFISLDLAAESAPPTETYPACARVQARFEEQTGSGGPTREAGAKLNDAEDRLCEALARSDIACRLLARVTHRGLREWMFGVDSVAGLADVARQVGEKSGIPLSTVPATWNDHESLRPTLFERMWMRDAPVVQKLLQAGTNASKPHQIEFFFQGKDDALARLRAALVKQGFVPLEGEPQPGKLAASKRLPLDAFAIAEQSVLLHGMAESAGVELDGWGAAIER